jgi:UDP-glucose 4-epimerase
MPQGILLIGGTGFVGRSLVARLSSIFPEIYTIARGDDIIESLPNVRHYQSGLDNAVLLKKLLPNCRVVFHLASETTPGSSILQPALEATNNLLPSLRFLECLQEYSHLSLIYVSTGGAIYGNTENEKVSEDMPLSPLSYYGAGKAALEKFICAYSRQTGNTAVILRPSNFYGPGQVYRQGFGIVPTIFNLHLHGKPLQLWGDGKTTRDYLYIDDFVNFCLLLLAKISSERAATIYNIGSGQGTTLLELISTIEEITGKKISRDSQPARTVDVRRIVLDNSRINCRFHWTPQTDLHTGLKKTWEWFRTYRT